MNDPELERHSLEGLWRQRVENAKLRVDFAQNRVKEVHREFPAPDIPPADGDFAFQKAIDAENAALREFDRVLRIFTDLVVRGIIPDESEWVKRQAAHADEGKSQV